VASEELLEPLLSLVDFEKSIQVNRPTVSQSDIAKHIAFTNESGGWIRIFQARANDDYRWRWGLDCRLSCKMLSR
jgi:hypothetical protein